MINSPARFGAFAAVLLAGLGLGYFVLGGHSNLPLVNSANAQTVADPPVSAPSASTLQNPPATTASSPSVGEQKLAEQMVHEDGKGRRLAPRGTFYILSYVSVKTDKGVEGFTPGEEVKFVSADRDKQTLVVSNGRAEIEVPASKLTNDLDMAQAAKNNDQANQARIAAYAQQQLEAYRKFEKEAAEATAKDLEQKRQEQAEAIQQAQEARAAAQATPYVPEYPSNGGGYYNDGGYGYGSPYSYFIINGAPGGPQTPQTSAAPFPGSAGGNKGNNGGNKIARPGGGGGPIGPAFAPSGNTGSGAPAANAGASGAGSNAGAARPPR